MVQRLVKPLDFLVVATNARFIAHSAVASGYAPSVIDGFTDAETRSLSRHAMRVPLNGYGLSVAHVRDACEYLFRKRHFAGVVLGSGLDGHPSFIDWLHTDSTLYANDARVFSCCRDHSRFARELERLSIPHPGSHSPISHSNEACSAGLPTLQKIAGACGGSHVRFGTDTVAYGQTYLPGTANSYLFLANGGRVKGIGWNTQWQSRHDSSQPFCYGGALNRSVSDPAMDARVEDYAQRLAQSFSLVGMNSLDYIVVGDEAYVLELNPRISATMQLHDMDGVLFDSHLAACESDDFPTLLPTVPRAHAVLYASHELRLAEGFAWPANACDLPEEADFAVGDPICTLLASEQTPSATLDVLQRDIRELNARLVAARRVDTHEFTDIGVRAVA